ncbi:hypothetical protein [Mycobacterium sp. 852014-52144_SCH5372336]|uniref:hypothetical protein n=1 Tax=Mycobacterium sp. 852014-52144_SCH5372336 TaxID=1834115 RepID=UPI0007FCA34F|nr:hypothetical protein [Mycobacterium sp. 852014-52144_SCH5372336]OBB73657.1 hypothetical protein A5759_14690 [Mycobacterium sp. 852014-52144_SCH5372336]
MLDWATLGQPTFDRVVEAMVRHRFGDSVRAVNGVGGDEGIDIEITLDGGRLWILQLKYFPEGFSSVWRARRTQITRSFRRALKHSPAKWTLVVPRVCSNPEVEFVKNLNSGKKPPVITVTDRDELDVWLAEAPHIERWALRNATSELREMARDFGQETATLAGGLPDLAARVKNLGQLANAADMDWKVGFANSDDATSVTISPRNSDAATRNPIEFAVELNQLGEEHQDLQQQILQALGYAPSGRLRIPGDVVRSVRLGGPDFIAGDYPPGAVEFISPPSGPAIGKRLAVRAFQDDEVVASFEGRITHSAPGTIGGSIEAAFCSGHLDVRLRLPHHIEVAEDAGADFPAPGLDLKLNYDSVRPSVVEDVLSTRRVICFATRLNFAIDGEVVARVQTNGPRTASDYDGDLLAIEQFAYDLDVVQRHTNHFFDIPDEIHPGDRVKLRVARLLIEGHIVASPRARVFTLGMTGVDTPEVRAPLLQPQSIVWPAGPYAVEIAGRELLIGDVYALHTQATAINGDEAIAALDAGNAEGFEVRFRPGDDPYFYLTLANDSPDQVVRRNLAQWTLWGVDQPGVSEDDSYELA